MCLVSACTCYNDSFFGWAFKTSSIQYSTYYDVLWILSKSLGPTEPQNVGLEADRGTGRSSILTWNEPSALYGTLSHYNIIIASVNDSTAAIVTHRVDADQSTINLDDIDDLDDGKYYVWVRKGS